MSATVEAITTDNITTVGVGVIVALVIVGFVIGAIITKLIVRVIVAIVVVVLAIVVWQQRGHVQDEFTKRCNTGATFFGYHFVPSDDLRNKCQLGG